MSAKSVRIPEQKCLYCGYVFTAVSNFAKPTELPDPGSANLCMKCGGLMVFGDKLVLRKPSFEELADLKANECWLEIERVRKGIQQLDWTKRRP